MSDLNKQDLEKHVKGIFKYNTQPAKASSRARFKAIMRRSLHELALRDIIIFFGALISAMMMLCSSLVKLMIKSK
ncbi:hypothetical protein EOL70_19840 [Leucothrix sargassi]|nr:hypothetical protein EOL70_19840 [Leucothrix sargassi]